MPLSWRRVIEQSNSTLNSEQGCAQIVNGQIFYSPNSSGTLQVPQPISCPDKFLKSVLDGNDFHSIERPQWWSHQLAFLPFIPLKPEFNFESLQCLARLPSPSLLRGKYIVDPFVQISWLDLEKIIIASTEALMRLSDYAGGLPPRPSAMGLDGRFEDAQEYRRALLRTREAFVMWTSAMSFFISLSISSDPQQLRLPQWFRQLSKQSFTQAWLDCVRASFIGTFGDKCPRVGLLVDLLAPSEFQGVVQWFSGLHVPVWYPWNNAEVQAAKSNPCIAQLAPPPHQLQNVAGFLTKSLPGEISTFESSQQHLGPSTSWTSQKSLAASPTSWGMNAASSTSWYMGAASSTNSSSTAVSSTGWGSSATPSTAWDKGGASSTSWGTSAASTGWGTSAASSTGLDKGGASSASWDTSAASTGWGSSSASSTGWDKAEASSTSWGGSASSSTGWGTTQSWRTQSPSQGQNAAIGWDTPAPPPTWDTAVPQPVGSLQRPSKRKGKARRFSLDNQPPTRDDLLSKRRRIEEPHTLHADPPVLVSASGDDKGHDEKPWIKFFARRAEANKRYMAKETYTQRQTRENRTRQPGLKKVFEWVIDEKKGSYVRRHVPKSAFDEAFREYGKHMQRYDPISNEWDLCHEFGPLDEDQIAEDEETHAWYLNMDGKQDKSATQPPIAVCEIPQVLAPSGTTSKQLSSEQRDIPAPPPAVPQTEVHLPQMTTMPPKMTDPPARHQNFALSASSGPLVANSPSPLLPSESPFMSEAVEHTAPEITSELLPLKSMDIPAQLHVVSQTQGALTEMVDILPEVNKIPTPSQNSILSMPSVSLTSHDQSSMSSAILPRASPSRHGLPAGGIADPSVLITANHLQAISIVEPPDEAESYSAWEEERMGPWIDNPTKDVIDPIGCEMLHALHRLYGFLKPTEMLVDSSAQLDGKEKMNLYAAVGFETADSDLPPSLTSSAKQFLALLSSDSSKIPSALWDMAPGNRLFSNMPQLSFCVRAKDCFVFDFGSQATMPWLLAVEKPALAVMIGRMDASFTDYDIASELVKMGAPFRTLLKVQGMVLVQPPAPAESLIPIREHEYVFTIEDYDNYVSRRDAFLRGPRGRAALLKGGYVWRLAVDALGYGVCFDGPSEAATLHGCGFLLEVGNAVEARPQQYCDDDLSEDELNLICGMYCCETATVGQFSHKSWFPLHGTWSAAAAFDHWTMRNEAEYFARLENIRKGEQPKNASAWAQNIKNVSHIRRLHSANAKVSLDVLSELIPA